MTTTIPTETDVPSLLGRVRAQLDRRPDLPGLASTVDKVHRLARDQRTRIQALSAAVADDPGLANRLMRVANAVHYRMAGAGSIASLQRAIAVMGFETVQRLATAVKLLDRVPRDEAGLQLREDFLQAVLAGRLAAELCTDTQLEEQAHLTALFQNLGRLLLAACLPTEALALQRARKGIALADWSLEIEAARRSQGMDTGQLGAHVARGWGWPASLVHAMTRDEWPRHRPRDRTQQLRWTGWLANDLARVMLEIDSPQWAVACDALAADATGATGRDARAMRAALAAVQPELTSLAASVGLPVARRRGAPETTILRRTRTADEPAPDDPCPTDRGAEAAAEDPRAGTAAARPGESPAPSPVASGDASSAASPAASADDRPAESTPSAVSDPAAASASDTASLAATARAAPAVDRRLLTREVLSLTAALVDVTTRAAVPARAVSALWRGLSARRAVLCLPQIQPEVFAPAVVCGEPLPVDAQQDWRIEPGRGGDLFARLCAHGSEALIDDARCDEIAPHLPPAFRRRIGARHFLVLPLRVDGRARGMLYVDRADDQPFTLDGDDLQLVRVLRDQMALALGEPAAATVA